MEKTVERQFIKQSTLFIMTIAIISCKSSLVFCFHVISKNKCQLFLFPYDKLSTQEIINSSHSILVYYF